jgi:hypothetical protein
MQDPFLTQGAKLERYNEQRLFSEWEGQSKVQVLARYSQLVIVPTNKYTIESLSTLCKVIIQILDPASDGFRSVFSRNTELQQSNEDVSCHLQLLKQSKNKSHSLGFFLFTSLFERRGVV